jgi:hypothetical protein
MKVTMIMENSVNWPRLEVSFNREAILARKYSLFPRCMFHCTVVSHIQFAVTCKQKPQI